MKEFNERLQYLIDSKKIIQQSLADFLGVHKSQITKWLKFEDGKKPRQESMIKIIDYFGCDYEWLKSGKGEPFPTNKEQEPGLSEINSGMKLKDLTVNEMQEPGTNMVRMYRHLAEMDADTLGEIQTWLNDTERLRPGFTGWFRLEFQNRFPEFDEWKRKTTKKQHCG